MRSEGINENYRLIETGALLLIFGVIYELWAFPGDVPVLDSAIIIGDEFGRTGAQIHLLVAVSSLVYLSIMVRNWVEATLGPLAVVQLLALITITSRVS